MHTTSPLNGTGHLTDTRGLHALDYVRAAIRVLEAAQAKRMNHTDATTVQEACDGLDIVQRVVAGEGLWKPAEVAARLRTVSLSIQKCNEPDVRIAHRDIESAAGIYQAMVNGL
jgi:hypothetical protein